MAWDYNPGRDGDNKTVKVIHLMQLVRGMDWEATSLCSQLEFSVGCPVGFKNSDLRF